MSSSRLAFPSRRSGVSTSQEPLPSPYSGEPASGFPSGSYRQYPPHVDHKLSPSTDRSYRSGSQAYYREGAPSSVVGRNATPHYSRYSAFNLLSFFRSARHDKLMAVYVVAAVVVAILAVVIAHHFEKTARRYDWPCWAHWGWVAAVLVVLTVLFAGSATAIASVGSKKSVRWTLLATFLIFGVLFLLSLWHLFRVHDPETGFYMLLGAVAAVVIHCVVMWKSAHRPAIIGVLPLLVLLLFTLWLFWKADRDRCGSLTDFCNRRTVESSC